MNDTRLTVPRNAVLTLAPGGKNYRPTAETIIQVQVQVQVERTYILYNHEIIIIKTFSRPEIYYVTLLYVQRGVLVGWAQSIIASYTKMISYTIAILYTGKWVGKGLGCLGKL